MRSGFCAVVGRPNVGKSTLVNAMVGRKVAITTPVPQTTRHAIMGVLHQPASEREEPDEPPFGEHPEDLQVVFVDTPGLHKPQTLLGSRLNEVARSQLAGVDVVVLVTDGERGVGRGDQFIAGLVDEAQTPTIAVLNKNDRIGPDRALPGLQQLADLGDWDEIVPTAAATGEGVDRLVELISARLPEGPPYFPPDMVSDQPLERWVAEVIREKALVVMREEVPHSIAVVVEEMGPGESEDVTAITAHLFVERRSQKGIVIGRGGEVLRGIGRRAREELELILGTKVWLDLEVKLAKEWQRDPKALQRFGY